MKDLAPYIEGRTAKRAGVVVGDNPYNEHDDRHWTWMAGWVEEAMQELKKQGKKVMP